MAHRAGARELTARRFVMAAASALFCLCFAAPVFPADQRVAPPATLSDSGPEPQLFSILDEIENNRLNEALEKTESLLRQYPNFRLAHLIKGDLLLARSAPLSTFGNASNALPESVNDLRDEIVVRLNAYRNRSAAADYIPRYLLQMPPDQKYAIVIDAQKSRLYLYQNDIGAGGRPRLVTDYYMSQGKLGADKMREGDKKTPIGVYHVTSSLNPKKIGDLYGTGAFPINYPNEWDKRLGRKGHGIWLHGTPVDTFSRPPKASDGCMVLANSDLDALAQNLQIGLTPVIISNSIEWLSFDDWQKERTALDKKIEEWRKDWESRDVDRYLKHYSKEFATNNQNREQFAAQKRRVNAQKTWIKLGLSNVSMFRDPGKDELVVVSFDQDYRSNNLNNRMKKRQYWIREDGTWKIIFEGGA
ncbi:MAG: L,D-transpeptidase family protein [Candidatus Accumulibacter sp.]|jgi:murein L,D-transpeptidase YafK|nr:L,D-transpeptidase family protein [Accumulibacter sp.]